MMYTPRILTCKLVAWISILTVVLPIVFWHRISLTSLAVPRPRPSRYTTSQFVAAGDTQCLPQITPDIIDESINKHASCRKFSPFTTGRARIATVTAHFGPVSEHYQKAFKTHLLHSLIHGTEVRVMCDPIIDDLWNKPAYILSLLMREMMKPPSRRLEWIMWVDRDTMILDQCRPMSSFLPPDPEKSYLGSWWRRDNVQAESSRGSATNTTEVNLLVTKDWNGLNNGIFLLRVNQWAVSLFTAILAFRHYKPDVDLPFTEQSAMEHVIRMEQFKQQTQLVPQHWFNAYDYGGPDMYARRDDATNLDPWVVRRGDYLVHFAGHSEKDKAIEAYSNMLRDLPDVWEHGTAQREIQGNITSFWNRLGY
ncbi:galactosyl transferase GMA12/MNN10 family protein [Phaeosphaeriaceae sp. SRC1lsM3a]|nr:galactosyl transferase GMA12/MNN10 family protein [Stagonospora sp. SRC1lsM3a]